MNKEKTALSISSDAPISSYEDDTFGYNAFAKLLGQAITNIREPKGLSIGLYGNWGQGKTSTLNLVENFLKESSEDIIVVKFNPWWFSGNDDLLLACFSDIQKTLKTEDYVRGKLSDFLIEYENLIEFFVSLSTGIPMLGKEVARKGSELLKCDYPLNKLKHRLNHSLKKSNIKIVIFIDDIDRLFPNEIIQIFTIIKSLLDLDNVIYLLSFDFNVVSEAINTQHGISGKEYIEKIIQVPFQLPLLNREQSKEFLKNRIKNIFNVEISFDYDILYNVLSFFKTPRDVIRFCNSLLVTYSAVKSSETAKPLVDESDFIAIEALRIFAYSSYKFVYENKELLTEEIGNSTDVYYTEDENGRENRSKEHVGMYNSSFLLYTKNDDQKSTAIAKNIINKLFFVYEPLFELIGDRRKEYKIANPQYFENYFKLYAFQQS